MDYNKLLKRFFSKSKFRTDLSNFWFKNNYVIATNSYILAKVKIQAEEDKRPDTENDNLPEIERTIPTEINQEITINPEYLYSIAKLFKDLNVKNKKDKQVVISFPKNDTEPIKFYQKQFDATALLMRIMK